MSPELDDADEWDDPDSLDDQDDDQDDDPSPMKGFGYLMITTATLTACVVIPLSMFAPAASRAYVPLALMFAVGFALAAWGDAIER